MGIVGDEGWADVATDNGQGFRQGMKRPDGEPTRPLFGKGQTGFEMCAEDDVVGLKVFDEEGKFVAPVEEGGIESVKPDDRFLEEWS